MTSVSAGRWVEHSLISLRLCRDVSLRVWSEHANAAPRGNREVFSVMRGTVVSADTRQLVSGKIQRLYNGYRGYAMDTEVI